MPPLRFKFTIKEWVAPNAIRAERSEQETVGGTSRIQSMLALLKSTLLLTLDFVSGIVF